MKLFKEKMIILFQVCVYMLTMFGGAMVIGYLLCLTGKERDYIPMEAITQTMIYVTALAISIVCFLTDFIFTKMGNAPRLILFFASIYVVGMTFFQFAAPHGPLDHIRYFMGFSIWILWMSGIALCIWLIYQNYTNNRYNNCLNRYKEKLAGKTE